MEFRFFQTVCVASVILAVLKLTGVITWSWIFVAAPIVLYLAAFVVGIFFATIAVVFWALAIGIVTLVRRNRK